MHSPSAVPIVTKSLPVGAASAAPSGRVYCANLFGNAGRNQLIGPRIVNLDFSVFKNNYIPRISESFNVQFRAEMFNVLNHANFQSPLCGSCQTLFNPDGSPSGVLADRVWTGCQLFRDGRARTIMCRCDNKEAVTMGQSLGINPGASKRFDSPPTLENAKANAKFGPGFELRSEDEEFIFQFHNLTQIDFAARPRPDTILKGQHQGLQKSPLIVRQIRGIRLA